MDTLLDTNRLFIRGTGERSVSPAFQSTQMDAVDLLRSPDFDTRLQTLNRLMAVVKRDPEWFQKFTKKGELFKNLDRILAEDRWEVQHQGIKFLMEAMPSLKSNLEYCACYVMPNLIPKLGSSKITVRRVTVQAIQTFLKLQPSALPAFSKMLVNFLLTSAERATKLEVLNELHNLYQPPLQEGNWMNYVDGLTKWTLAVDRETGEKIAVVLKRLEIFISAAVYSKLLSEVPEKQRAEILKLSADVKIEPPEEEHIDVPNALANRAMMKSGERRFRFGIVPTYIETMLNDEEPSTRMAALEKLKVIMEKITPEEVSRLVPHLHSYFVQLGYVLADLNFKVVVMALDLVRLTVNRLKQHIDAHLQQVVQLISRHFGNQKAVIKQIIMMTCMDLFHNLNPKSVVAVLGVFLDNKNSRTREEVINIMTAALMTANSSRVNFIAVSNILVPLLADPKRRVRLAAFEQLSVLAYMMNGKVEPLLKCVRETEEKLSLPGLQNAVMARLRRHLLPRIRYDGLIEYATPPVTDCSFDVDEEQLKETENLDLYWILHANVGESGDRPVSPISIANFKSNNRLSTKGRTPKLSKGLPMPWETESERDDITSIHSLPFMERMQSDDQIIRKPGSSKAINQNPNESTHSWHSPGPKRNNSITGDDDRAIATVNRLNGVVDNELSTSLDKVRFHALQKKTEMNNNTIQQTTTGLKPNGIQTTNGVITAVKPKPKPKKAPPQPRANLSRARSDSHLSEERENQMPPLNPDDVPIRPAKNAQYIDEYAYGSNGYDAPAIRKSTSHHSLPIATTQTAKARKHNFLKSGTGNRVGKPINGKSSATSTKSVPIERTQQKQISVDGVGVHSVLRKIDSEEWQDKVDGLQMIIEMSNSNQKQISDNLHEVVVAILNECRNLRSSVSRVAISALGTLFDNMRGKMDPEIEKTCTLLMQKSGDVSNAFIREDATDSLDKLVKHGSPNKVLQSLIAAGAKSKNNNIRSSCASFITQLVNRVGYNQVINSPEFFTKLISMLIHFSKDPHPGVRNPAKSLLHNLSQDQHFERQLRKGSSEQEVKAVKEILGNISKKGGIESLDSTMVLSASLNRAGSVKKNAVKAKLPDNVQLDLDQCRTDLTAAGWERRIEGLKRFEEMTSSMSRAVASDTKLIEAFIGRLSDINSKVALDAMETYLATLPIMGRLYSTETPLKAVLNQLIHSLMSHLPSRSEEHRHLAQTCLLETVKQIDGAALSPAVAATTRKANVKQRPFMLNIFNRLNISLYRTKPKQVEVCAIPILFELLKTPPPDAENRKAIQEFSRTLAKLMGERAFLDAGSAGLDPSKKAALEQMVR